MSYGPTSPLGGIRIFYSSTILWDSDLSSTRVKWFLLTLTLGSHNYFSRRAPHSRWLLGAPKDSKDTLWCSLETLCLLLLQFPTTEISLWINTYTCRSYFYSQLILLLQDTLKSFLLSREYFVPTALQFLATWISLWIISYPYRVSIHPQLFMCFTMVFEILFDPPKILSSLLLCNTCLLALWMLSICLTIFICILRHHQFDPIDSTWVRMHAIISWSF